MCDLLPHRLCSRREMADDGETAKEAEQADEGEEAEQAPLPGAGTPDGEALVQAHRAFDAGDYKRLRALCEGLLEAKDEEVAGAARELRRRTEVDPVQIGVILACLVLFLVIAYVYVV